MEVTEVIATNVVVECPNCKQRLSGFYGDPRGHQFTCEFCTQKFSIHSEADIEMR